MRVLQQRFKQSPEREDAYCDRRRWVTRRAPRFLAPVILVAALFCGHAHAQWSTQTITLKPGWNAVFLELEPEPKDCATVFAGIPVESVWYWSPVHSTVQFTRDPNNLVPDDPDWPVYFPDTSLARAVTTLRVLRGNRTYMIKLGGTAIVNWSVQGKPSTRALDWISDSYNLVGFSTDPAGSPTVQQLFAGSLAHVGQPVFRFRDTQLWEQVTDPATEHLQKGEAVWVYTSGTSAYQGPLRVELGASGDLAFGRGVPELTINLWNPTASAKVFTIRVLDSEVPAPAAKASKALAGAVPLSYWKDDYATGDMGWCANTQPVSVSVAANSSKPLRLSPRRRDMNSSAKSLDESLYQSIIKITDGAGMAVMLPVTAQGLESTTGPASHSYAGLWVGSATINRVSQPSLKGAEGEGEGEVIDHETPQATGSEFQFTLIVHVDKNGQARFLQQVTMMWKDGTTKPDPVFAGGTVMDVPGKYVLITDESRLIEFKGSTMRGGVPVGRRFSTPVFGFSAPIDMTGAFPTPGAPVNTVACSVPLRYDDPLNPFVHKYHPDHNNLDEYYEEPLPDGQESWSITRDVSLEFVDYVASKSVLAAADAGWGDQWIGGTYRETVTGLHKTPVYVQGTFRLTYVSDVAELNPEN